MLFNVPYWPQFGNKSPYLTAAFSYNTAEQHQAFLFLLGVPFSRLCLTVSFAKLLFHWPASVAKIFIVLSPSMLFCLHHTLSSLILWVWLWRLCVSVCASKVCRLRQLECLYLQGTLWWAISGLLFPQCLSVENISMHQCFPCFFTLHICNPESPFAPKAFFKITLHPSFCTPCMQMSDIWLPYITLGLLIEAKISNFHVIYAYGLQQQLF